MLHDVGFRMWPLFESNTLIWMLQRRMRTQTFFDRSAVTFLDELHQDFPLPSASTTVLNFRIEKIVTLFYCNTITGCAAIPFSKSKVLNICS